MRYSDGASALDYAGLDRLGRVVGQRWMNGTGSTVLDWHPYSYDHRNRLRGLTYKNASGTVTQRISYRYDVNDRRIEKQIDASPCDGTFETIERYI